MQKMHQLGGCATRVHPPSVSLAISLFMKTDITPEEEQRYAELQAMALDFARHGDAAALEPMLQAGMPVNLADHKQNTLLMLAAYHGHEQTVRLLLENGARVDQRNDRQQTPLGGVAFKGHAEIAKMLIGAGADVDADNGNGMTPLMFARMFGREAVAHVLEQSGADRQARVRGFSLGQIAVAMRILRVLVSPIVWLRSRFRSPKPAHV